MAVGMGVVVCAVDFNRSLVAYCKLNKARMAEQRNDIKQSLDYAKEAETLFVQFGDRREIAADLHRIQEKAAKVKLGIAASK